MISEGFGMDAEVLSLEIAHLDSLWVLQDTQGNLIGEGKEGEKVLSVFQTEEMASAFINEVAVAMDCQPQKYGWDELVEKFGKLGLEKAIINPSKTPAYLWTIPLKKGSELAAGD